MRSRAAVKHIAVRIHPGLYRQFRLAVVRRNTTLQSAMLEAIQQWLRRPGKETGDVRRRRIAAARGLFAGLAPERMLSEELIAERRAEAQLE